MPTTEAASKRRLRWRRGAAIAAAAALVAAAIWVRHLTRAGLGPESGSVHLAGLSAAVKVTRDAAGIPHIYAQERLDLARALGYVEACDRAFQSELSIRLAEGRLAEIFGPDLVETDYVFRLFDPERFARESLALYPPAMRAELDAYVEGRNAWAESHSGDPPLAFRLLGITPMRVTALDVEAAGLPLAVLLGYNLTEESLYLNLAHRIAPGTLAELFPVYPGSPLELPPAAIPAELAGTRLSFPLASGFAGLPRTGIAASNNWVVDGSKSVSGRPMLANDPHLPQSIPSIWYEAVLVTPAGFVAGAMPAGSPLVAIGTNGHVAWGVTSVQADVMDLSLEKLSPDGERYLFRDQWYPLERREVVIKVAGGSDVQRAIRSTRHGPIVSEALAIAGNPLSNVAVRGTYALALRFAGLTPASAGRVGIEAALARSGKDLVEAYRHFAITPLNLVWADVDGNIGFHVVGAIPRRVGFDGKYPTPGWTGEFEWSGMIPYDELPHFESPPEHFIVTANNRMSDVAYNGSWAAPFRRDRIAGLLAARDRLAPDDFREIQNDRVSLHALKLRKVILEAGDAGDADLAWAFGELRGFDGAMTANSRAASIIAATEVALAKRVFKDRLGGDFPAFLKLQDTGGYCATEEILDRPDIDLWSAGRGAYPGQTIRASLKDALVALRQKLGSDHDRWTWGTLHSITFKHPLGERGGIPAWYFNRGPMESAGDRHTVNNGWFNLAAPYETEQVSSFRFIVDMADPQHALAMNHTGESETPASPHYDDLIQPWRAGDYHVLDAGSGWTASSELDFLPVNPR